MDTKYFKVNITIINKAYDFNSLKIYKMPITVDRKYTQYSANDFCTEINFGNRIPIGNYDEMIKYITQGNYSKNKLTFINQLFKDESYLMFVDEKEFNPNNEMNFIQTLNSRLDFNDSDYFKFLQENSKDKSKVKKIV